MENNGKRKDGSLSYLKYVLIIAVLLAYAVANLLGMRTLAWLINSIPTP